ncbi:MAG: hypothetical protein IJS51_06080 [Treponema sp.]|nr:hypothetical protein [Treponema sp.]MBQ7619679.1 hypothetical protein [Treponema sp.]
MKRNSFIAAVLLGAVLFFGCSNSSDDGIRILQYSGGESVSVAAVKTTGTVSAASQKAGALTATLVATNGSYAFTQNIGASANVANGIAFAAAVDTAKGGTWIFRDSGGNTKYLGTYKGDISKFGTEEVKLSLAVEQAVGNDGAVGKVSSVSNFDFNAGTTSFEATIPEVKVQSSGSSSKLSWTAIPVANGVQFTINALPEKYRKGYSVWVQDQHGTRCIPNWNNMAAAWTGLYPLVEPGKTYNFTLFVSKGNDSASENVEIKAAGGIGEVQYSTESWSAVLSIKTKTQADADGYMTNCLEGETVGGDDKMICVKTNGFSISDSKVENRRVNLCWFNGNGFVDDVWDGEFIGEIARNTEKDAYTKSLFDAFTNSQMTRASNKKFFVEVQFKFTLSGSSDFDCMAKAIQSTAIEYPW